MSANWLEATTASRFSGLSTKQAKDTMRRDGALLDKAITVRFCLVEDIFAAFNIKELWP
jgi:hypothetical protein